LKYKRQRKQYVPGIPVFYLLVHLIFCADKKFKNKRAAPTFPAGNCLKNANVV